MEPDLERDGFAIIPDVLSPDALRELLGLLGPVHGAGDRGLLDLPEMIAFARSESLLALVRPYLTAFPLPVRAISFDKSPESNWLVPWHQDLTVAVKARAETPGFGPWSVKEGVPHVQPPDELLGRMLTVRLHLDGADETNGALRVLPGSHRLGRLSSEAIRDYRATESEFLCEVPAGGALLMRPLLLHASGRSTSNRHRRVLHLEYAGFDLPAPLLWRWANGTSGHEKGRAIRAPLSA